MLGWARDLILAIALEARPGCLLAEALLLKDIEAVTNALRIQDVVIKLLKALPIFAVGVFGTSERRIFCFGLGLAHLNGERAKLNRNAGH